MKSKDPPALSFLTLFPSSRCCFVGCGMRCLMEEADCPHSACDGHLMVTPKGRCWSSGEWGLGQQQWVLFKSFSLEATLRRSQENSRSAFCNGAEQLSEINIKVFLSPIFAHSRQSPLFSVQASDHVWGRVSRGWFPNTLAVMEIGVGVLKRSHTMCLWGNVERGLSRPEAIPGAWGEKTELSRCG